jgi:hypothetical protein
MGADPVSLALMASAAVSAGGSVMEGYAANNAAKFNAGMSMNNAKIAKQNADLAGEIGTAKSEASQMKTAAQVGATTASQGASGVQIGGKSFQDVRESEQKIGALEAMNIRSNAAREAYGFKVQEASDIAQAKQLKAEGKNALIGGFVKGASVLGTAAVGAAGGSGPDGNFAKLMGSKSLGGGLWEKTAYGLNEAGFGNTAYEMLDEA